jgi:hypothetical protein
VGQQTSKRFVLLFPHLFLTGKYPGMDLWHAGAKVCSEEDFLKRWSRLCESGRKWKIQIM